MSFSDAIKACMGNYAIFRGRATRSEYWWFYLFTVLMVWGASIVEGVTLPADDSGSLSMLTGLVFLIPSLAAGSRRLHDTGRSGWWQLLYLTLIGAILVIYWLAKEGDNHQNKYGAPPSIRRPRPEQ